MRIWENVKHLDEHYINLVQVYSRATKELLVLTETEDDYFEVILLKADAEITDNVITYLADAEDIYRLRFEDYPDAFDKFIEILLEQ